MAGTGNGPYQEFVSGSCNLFAFILTVYWNANNLDIHVFLGEILTIKGMYCFLRKGMFLWCNENDSYLIFLIFVVS